MNSPHYPTSQVLQSSDDSDDDERGRSGRGRSLQYERIVRSFSRFVLEKGNHTKAQVSLGASLKEREPPKKAHPSWGISDANKVLG